MSNEKPKIQRTLYASHENWLVVLSKLEYGQQVIFDQGPIKHDDIIAATKKMGNRFAGYTVGHHGDRYHVMKIPGSNDAIVQQGEVFNKLREQQKAVDTFYHALLHAELVPQTRIKELMTLHGKIRGQYDPWGEK